MPRLIDAEALDKKLADLMLKYAWQAREERVAEYAFCRGQVMAAPTIDPESLRPHGRWEEGESGFLVCSECADVFILEEWLADGKWKYCPNCGEKMDEEEDK